MRITLVTGAAVEVDLTRRTLTGTLFRYDETGLTSAGPLTVAASMPLPPLGLPLTLEHDRGTVRGELAAVDHSAERVRVTCKVADSAAGDAALYDAKTRKRAGLSFDITDADVVDGAIVTATWAAIGQVETPAFNSARIDQIAASLTTEGAPPMFTAEQAARLIELQGKDSLSPEEQEELDALLALAALYPPAEASAEAPAEEEPVTAAAVTAAQAQPAVPGSVPAPARRSAVVTASRPDGQFWRPGDLKRFTDALVGAAPNGAQAITAALADITHTAHTSIIEPPAWSGELWSGLEYEPIWSDLFATGELTNFEGKGWRFKTKLVMQDYAGDKVEIPTSTIETEPASYEAARMAVGVDIDRKFFDFKNAANAAFLASLPEQARESWAMKLDDKVRAYTLANAVVAEGAAAQPTLLKAAAVAIRALRRRKVLGRGASTWVVVNDDDLFTLMDYNQLTLPAFLDLWGIDPRNFRSDQAVPAGTVVAGARQAAQVRTLPGSPIRVDAQNIALGGIDEAFFGYWAIEEHHPAGIAKATYTEPVGG